MHTTKPLLFHARRMQRHSRLLALAAWLVSALLMLPQAALADQVLTTPDGRKVQLKDDGTWRYQDAAAPAKDAPKGEPAIQAQLRLEKKVERGAHCRLVLSLANDLPYEIKHFIPYVSVYRAGGVVHETVSMAFQSIRPADKIEREADFSRITCAEITRVQVVGGDRCEMGELHKFSESSGQCLARVRVLPSDLVRFDK